MQTSQQGLDLICRFEGFAANRYICPAGKPTIGYGHVIHAGEAFDEPLSEGDALELLLTDLPNYETRVLNLVEVELTQGQFDALVSFAYNLGTNALATSTLLNRLNSGDVAAAADEFLRWNKATVKGQKVVLAGLTARREAEQELFLS